MEAKRSYLICRTAGDPGVRRDEKTMGFENPRDHSKFLPELGKRGVCREFQSSTAKTHPSSMNCALKERHSTPDGRPPLQRPSQEFTRPRKERLKLGNWLRIAKNAPALRSSLAKRLKIAQFRRNENPSAVSNTSSSKEQRGTPGCPTAPTASLPGVHTKKRKAETRNWLRMWDLQNSGDRHQAGA